MTKKRRIFRRIGSILLVLLLLLGGAFFLYTGNYYHADSTAIDPIIDSPNYSTDENLSILTPDDPNGTGFIFYPGAKVEDTAYLPLLSQLCQQGITCILVDMPFHLAIFHQNAADNVYAKFPGITHWFIGGHSLGGAMASSYYSSHENQLDGLILLGAYIYKDVPVQQAITIYGSEDHVLDRSKITYTENVFVIEGGNHDQFGNYGKQSGDGTALISSQEQQEETVQYILTFMEQIESTQK